MKAGKTIVVGILLGCMLSFAACNQAADESNNGSNNNINETQKEQIPEEEQMTLGEVADYLIEVAAGYGSRIEKDTLLLDLEERESDTATRLDMLVVTSRAFGNLPQPDDSKKQAEEIDISEVPDWAASEIENLSQAGLLKESDLESESDLIAKADIDDFIERMMNTYSN